MAEFIGARISLVSRSDIRYVGTLHEINSENATVALENVTSFGTEDRKGADESIPPSDAIYDYIVFRGSDVKDLRIEKAPAAKENKPQVPNDPAIMSSGSTRPPPVAPNLQAQHQRQQGQGQEHRQQQQESSQPQTTQGQGSPQGQGPQQGYPQGPPQGPPFGHPQYPPHFYPPPGGGWGGRGGPPGPPFPPMPYGAPPGWYPPPGQHGFPPGPFPPYGFPPGPHNPQFQQGPGQPKPAPIGPGANKQQNGPSTPAADKEAEPKSLAKPAAEMAATTVQKATSPSASKAPASEVNQPSTAQIAATGATKSVPTGPKPNRIQPAIPLKSPANVKAPLHSNAGNVVSAPTNTPASLRDATQAATAAVAAAMAKLPQANGSGSAMDNLTKKVNEMRSSDPIRAPRQPGSAAGFERGRGRGRGGSRNSSSQKVEVPATDFDFESSNAKFNKQDLVKEAIAGSPLTENPPSASPSEPDTQAPGYNKTKSFFDDISSESKERAEGASNRPGGREWRGEEQKKNVETFGQGSVDNGGYRGGYRGRGRGRGHRGRGYSGNGQPQRARGGYRGGDGQ